MYVDTCGGIQMADMTLSVFNFVGKVFDKVGQGHVVHLLLVFLLFWDYSKGRHC